MKLGTFIFLLMMILISFGYVISHDQEARRRLKEALEEIERLKFQAVQVDQQLNSCYETVQNNQLLNSQLSNEVGSLKSIVSGKDDEIRSLKTVISQQDSRIVNLEKALLKFNHERNKLQVFDTAITWLQFDPVVLALIVIVQIILFIIQKRQKRDCVRLSGEERALIINLRRMKKM